MGGVSWVSRAERGREQNQDGARGAEASLFYSLSLGPNATTPQLPVSGLSHHTTIVFFPVGHRDHVVGGRRVVGRNQETRKGRQGTDPRSAGGTQDPASPRRDLDVVARFGVTAGSVARARGAFPTQSSRCGKAGDDGPPAHAMFKRLHSH